ncbi:SNF2-related protein [Planctomycetota bacterium]
MPKVTDVYNVPSELVLGTRMNERVPEADQKRQRTEVEEILKRLQSQPGVILADEVGMGKTFVALAIVYSVGIRRQSGPVVIMVPANLVDKWEQDLKTFCELYLENRYPLRKENTKLSDLRRRTTVRYGIARHSVEFLKLLDDHPRERCHLIFLSQGSMSRRQTDKWVRLALIAATLRRHGRGQARRLINVKNKIHRFLGELLHAQGEQRAHEWGVELWKKLLKIPPIQWMETYNHYVANENRQLTDDPVPEAVVKALDRIDLSPLASALTKMPIRAAGGKKRISERIKGIRDTLKQTERVLWREILAETRWRSPLLVMDEAHHLKNPRTSLARQLQSPDVENDIRTGDGAMARTFDRMLFLTATPFQLGHQELLRVLQRFGDVKWRAKELGEIENLHQELQHLGNHLNDSQRTAITLQRSWSRLRPEDIEGDIEIWWKSISESRKELLNNHQRAVVDAYNGARRSRNAAQKCLQSWIVRHNKGDYWVGTDISRRQRMEGATITGEGAQTGLAIPPKQLLPFFLAARSAVYPGKDLLGEALCSSYEAFRFTRQKGDLSKDDQEDSVETMVDLSRAGWYLKEFDHALDLCSGSAHPKMHATVQKVVDLWEVGEKVLVFAFYRYTCRSLRLHISSEIERRMMLTGKNRLSNTGIDYGDEEISLLIDRIQNRYFDRIDSPGRRAVDAALNRIVSEQEAVLRGAHVSIEQRELLIDVMRRFLRVSTTLIRCFPISELDTIEPSEAVEKTIEHTDASGMSWRQKFSGFINFLTTQCSSKEREDFLDAVKGIQTGGIRVEGHEEDGSDESSVVTLANVQMAIGTTLRDRRTRLMRAFNTPFFPDILVCSEVMGEGVDLHRFCRHVIHHDLAWNPSSIEQRTGRIDRLGCKAEGRQPIVLYLPYLAGTADERQYQVMTEREQWFRVVMGQDQVAQLITADSNNTIPLPNAISEELNFKLGL